MDEGSLDRTIIAEPKSRAFELFMANVQSQRLGRYELVEKIGEGSAEIVYRAIDVLEDRTVAVKVLKPAGVSGPSSLIRFEKEARLLSRINHPCIAAHLDFNNDRGVSYLVVEYLPGGTLSGYVAGLSICGEKEIVRLILDAVRGLAAAHEQGIVHRDIKPENLLLTETGHRLMTRLRDRSVSSFSMTDQTAELQSDDTTPLLKLSDFGLARFEQQTESLAITRDGAILGTPLYMSPEQCRGEVAGPASDVYSLGATLFHLIAGRPPFEGTTNISVINQHCHNPAPSLRSFRQDVSDVLSQIVDRCLSKTPEARYRGAQELLPVLEHFLAGRPSSIRLHPPAPNGGEQVLEFRLSASLKSSPTQLWPFISNTDRVNQSLGLTAVSYTTRIHPERGNELFAETRIAGQQLQWQEHPYEWIEGRRMSVLREFSAGPFHWFMNVVELQPTADGGTEVTQTFRVAPRGWIGSLLARFQLGRRSPLPSGRSIIRLMSTSLRANGAVRIATPMENQSA